MAWTLDGIRIFVQKKNDDDKQVVAVLQPLNGGSVFQYFGYENESIKINGLIVGDTDKAALKALTRGGSTFTLIGPTGDLGDFVVKEVQFDEQLTISQTIRPDLPCDSPVYAVTIDLQDNAT